LPGESNEDIVGTTSCPDRRNVISNMGQNQIQIYNIIRTDKKGDSIWIISLAD